MEDDAETLEEVAREVVSIEGCLDQMEFTRMFRGEVDINNAFIDIQSGSGGTPLLISSQVPAGPRTGQRCY